MGFRDIFRGLKEDVQTIKKARKTGQLRKECAQAKKYGTYKERVLACGLSKILDSNKKKRRSKKKCRVHKKRRR